MNVLVLGAYGLIGRAVVSELLANGHTVTGLARSAETGRALIPEAHWIGADLAGLTTPEAWVPHLFGIEAIVNAAGVLQASPRDPISRIQDDAIVALIAAAEQSNIATFVQISAPGAAPTASTEFLASKGRADDHLRASRLGWVILKPGLVIAPTAYGGTALIRALAAFPAVQPLALPGVRIQTVDVDDVARATRRALEDPALTRQTFDLVEERVHTLRAVVAAFRRWLGFGEARTQFEPPRLVTRAMSALSDLAGLLGWRAPMRSTALKVLEEDVVGDPGPWRHATGERLASLEETLARLPATLQERQYARTALTFPLVLGLFALFWIASGMIAIVQHEAAEALVAPQLGEGAARLLVIGGAGLDIAIGVGLLLQRWYKPACLAAIVTSLAYLAGGTLIRPDLWADPLGPLVKVLPVIGLAMALAAMGDER